MAQFQCPNCGGKTFHIKDPDGNSFIWEFEYRDGEAFFGVWTQESDRPTPDDDTSIFCNVCAWQGRFHTGRQCSKSADDLLSP